ncbi:PTS lactose transporter subunit IIA [Companilactobacillus ginsenosidimutans]|uniref:PTS lactose transporter subunit IIA n=2 Tax=Companilactobacillus ginsenosidimutans TaxID=1007676 RepID=A0A0H4QNT5_9LACO|nr:PTS lactose transporter subunit IIA [Companilactobacillus ginsenosidimutans]
MDREELSMISMQVIMHAGNAREHIFKAVDLASQSQFEEAEKMMAESNIELIAAHQAQTNTIQLEAGGTGVPYSTLFTHAQDTLMSVKTEQNLIKEMIKLYKRLGEK